MGRDQPRQKVGIFSGIYIQEFLLLISCSFVVGQGSLSFFRPGSSGATDSTQENAAQGSAIYTVIATGGAGGYIYGVVSQIPPTPQFPFGTSSGELTSPTSLDAETTQQFTFVFNCTSGSETITSSQFVLDVRDVNDNTPHFLNLPYSVSIQNSQPTGSSIFTVTADDDDITPASLEYTITGGDTTNAFSLDSSSGVLTVAVSNNLQIGTQTLSVRVSDGTFTNTTSISVTISEDYCASTPCQNSGTCTNGPNSFLCACAPGWTGQTCSDVDHCASSPCLNGGTCQNNDSTFQCTCDSGWQGNACHLVDPCYPNPCQNGGTCMVTGTYYRCTCTPSYSGTNCTTQAADGGSGDDANDNGSMMTLVIVATVVPVVIFMLVMAGIVVYKYKRPFLKNNKVPPSTDGVFKYNPTEQGQLPPSDTSFSSRSHTKINFEIS